MSDLISREEAIEAVRGLRVEVERSGDFIYNAGLRSAERILTEIPSAEEPLDLFARMYRAERELLPSADVETHDIRTETHECVKETHDSDLISRADAMGAVQDHFNANGFKGYDDGQKMMDRIKALPSADRPINEDLVQRSDVLEVCEILPQGWYEKMTKAINEVPSVSADRPTIVRCKDCIWGNEWNDKQIFCDRILMRLRETDFCAYGERGEK